MQNNEQFHVNSISSWAVLAATAECLWWVDRDCIVTIHELLAHSQDAEEITTCHMVSFGFGIKSIHTWMIIDELACVKCTETGIPIASKTKNKYSSNLLSLLDIVVYSIPLQWLFLKLMQISDKVNNSQGF